MKSGKTVDLILASVVTLLIIGSFILGSMKDSVRFNKSYKINAVDCLIVNSNIVNDTIHFAKFKTTKHE